MEPWYRLVTPRKEVREGRSFNPDEFAIALEQVVAGSAPDDYKKPEQFFSRTCFTRALRDNSGLVLRRLAGKTENTAPVQTLVTQMGGGKTHMLTTLWHLANTGAAASAFPGVGDLLSESGLTEAPKAKVAVFVGNAWDPQPGRETPWIDIARQLAGDAGVEVLGPSAIDAPPGRTRSTASSPGWTARSFCSSTSCSTCSAATAAWPSRCTPSCTTSCGDSSAAITGRRLSAFRAARSR